MGLWPPQKSMGVLMRGLSFAELGTRRRRWRRRWRRFGPRLGPRRGSRRRGGRGRASAGQAAGRGRGAPRPSALGPWPLSPQPARAGCGCWGREGLVPSQGATRPALGVPPPTQSRRSFPRPQRKAWGPGSAPGRSRGCHLGDSRHLLRTALSSSFLSSLLPPEVPSRFPPIRTERPWRSFIPFHCL